jgi:hypothetical protein
MRGALARARTARECKLEILRCVAPGHRSVDDGAIECDELLDRGVEVELMRPLSIELARRRELRRVIDQRVDLGGKRRRVTGRKREVSFKASVDAALSGAFAMRAGRPALIDSSTDIPSSSTSPA